MRSRIEISRTLGFVSWSAHGSCDRNRHRRCGNGYSKAESRGVTSNFFGLLAPSVSGRGRGTQKTVRSRIEISRSLGFVSWSAHGSCDRNRHRRGSGCSKAESRGATSDFFGLLPPYVPGRSRGAQKTLRSRFEISQTLGFVSTSAHGSCNRNRHGRHGRGCSKAESRGATSDFFWLLLLSVPRRSRGAQKILRSHIEISQTLGFVSSSAHGSCNRNRHRRRGSGCSKAESRGATSDFFGLLPP